MKIQTPVPNSSPAPSNSSDVSTIPIAKTPTIVSRIRQYWPVATFVVFQGFTISGYMQKNWNISIASAGFGTLVTVFLCYCLNKQPEEVSVEDAKQLKKDIVEASKDTSSIVASANRIKKDADELSDAGENLEAATKEAEHLGSSILRDDKDLEVAGSNLGTDIDNALRIATRVAAESKGSLQRVDSNVKLLEALEEGFQGSVKKEQKENQEELLDLESLGTLDRSLMAASKNADDFLSKEGKKTSADATRLNQDRRFLEHFLRDNK